MLKRFKQAWKRDRLGVLGVGSAALTLALFSLPQLFSGRGYWFPVHFGTYEYIIEDLYGRVDTIQVTIVGLLFPIISFHQCKPGASSLDCDSEGIRVTSYDWFTQWEFRLPAIGAFLALAVILLLLRRR
jgi:hypothetical protein